MRLETFFEKFDTLAEMPGAVETLRELIVQRAISGKLVPNDPTEAPVTLELPGDSTRSSKRPMNWRHGKVRDAFAFEYGDNLPAPKRSETGEYPVYGSNGIVGTHEKYLTKEPAIIVGRKGSAGALNIATGPSWTTDVAYYVRPPNEIDLQFTYYLFSTLRLDQLGKGIKPGLSRSEAYELPIAVPPLAEQRRIVAKVQELMALCDRLEAQQRERETRHVALSRAALARFADAPTPANLQLLFHPSYTITPADLRKFILTLAVQGKLVPQYPSDEPANETLAKVLRDRGRQEKSLRIKEPSPIDAHPDHTPELPSGWCYASPDQLTAFHKNALTIGPFGSSLLKSDYTGEGVPLVFVRDIRSERFGGPETQFVTPDKAGELASHSVRPGDLLITKMGDPPGDTAIYPLGRPPAIITADCIKLTPHPDVVTAEYLRFAIRASQIAEQFAGITLGVAQQKVSLGRFRCIAVPLPPLAEQHRIVAKVEQLMGLVDTLESKLAASCATAQNILADLTRELGSGSLLVPAGTAMNYYRQA